MVLHGNLIGTVKGLLANHGRFILVKSRGWTINHDPFMVKLMAVYGNERSGSPLVGCISRLKIGQRLRVPKPCRNSQLLLGSYGCSTLPQAENQGLVGQISGRK